MGKVRMLPLQQICITGKPICDDLRTKKKTLPVLHALETERKRGKRTLRDLYSREKIGDDVVNQDSSLIYQQVYHLDFCVKVLLLLMKNDFFISVF